MAFQEWGNINIHYSSFAIPKEKKIFDSFNVQRRKQKKKIILIMTRVLILIDEEIHENFPVTKSLGRR